MEEALATELDRLLQQSRLDDQEKRRHAPHGGSEPCLCALQMVKEELYG